ncbi:reverse transcriptase [Tanacetum coccineum]|uniref:Reverse transcriptase n=1 Tax=Tanacetum coccineum TaxID=301880 RepID=A0ABQ5FPK0_9ASTR
MDNILADGAARDMSRLRFFHLSLKGKPKECLDRMPPAQITKWDQLVMRFRNYCFPVGRTSILQDMILRFKQGTNKPIKRAWIRFQDLIKQVPHHGIQKWLLVHIFHDNISSEDREKLDQFTYFFFSPLTAEEGVGENSPDWVVQSKFEDELFGFMLEKKFHTKGLGEMFDQHRKGICEQLSHILSAIRENKTPKPDAPTFPITTRSGTSTRDPPYPLPPKPTTIYHAEGTVREEGPEGEEPSIIKDDDDERLLSIYQQIHINLPFLEAMIHMPKGAKVLKYLLSHKEKLKKTSSSVKINEESSSVIQGSSPQKEGDPGSFTLPCHIRSLTVKNALADLGASINLMQHSLFRRLGISKLKPTRMSIQLVDRSIKYPIGVCENLLVKINKFIFSVDFVVLEIDEDELVPIILGWPFVATAQGVIDVHEGRLSLRVDNETFTFNIGKSMKYKCSRDDYLYYADHTTKLIREQWVDTVGHDKEWIESEKGRDSDEVRAVSFYLKAEPVEPPKLELKSYPDIEKANFQ